MSNSVIFMGIMHELGKAMDAPWAPIELRALVNSYGDTMTDGEILQCLREYNAGRHRLRPLPWPLPKAAPAPERA